MERSKRNEIAISCRNVCKSFDGKKDKLVLDHLNMTVRKGTIYGLLGASGCGKTTLLSAIVGTRQIQQGLIFTNQQSLKSIGYMPQEIALAGELTVKGAIQHYGWIFGMTNEEIDKRYEFLHQLLDLPPRYRMIKHLSGGQQRRVSLAVVLVHDPSVLILDEPTVGLDPVLRQHIWDYLLEQADLGKTIIITTHYIEEARQAHSIGLMRNGKILAEGSPEKLMEKFNCSTVEDVFLILCRKQLEGNLAEHYYSKNAMDDKIPYLKPPDTKKNKKDLFFTNHGHAKALLTKNFYKFTRHVGTILFALAFPIMQTSLFFLCIGGDPINLHLGVVNQEIAHYKSCEDYQKNQTIGAFLDAKKNCYYETLSCKYLLGTPSDLAKFVYFETPEDALSALRNMEIVAFLEFKSNFTHSMETWKQNNPLTIKEADDLQIVYYEHFPDYPISKFVQKGIIERYLNFSKELEEDCGFESRWADIPMKVHDPIYGVKNPSYQMFMAPGYLLTCSVFLAISVSALTIVTERKEGEWERAQVAGVSKTEILIFHFITMAIMNAVQNAIIYGISFFIFGMECSGSRWVVLLILTTQGIVGVAFGIFLSVVSRTIIDCIYMSLGLFYPFLVLSGLSWPLEGMHPWMRTISYYLMPSTISVEALSNVIRRGWSLTNYDVSKGLYSSLAWVASLILINILVLKLEKS